MELAGAVAAADVEPLALRSGSGRTGERTLDEPFVEEVADLPG